MKRKLVASLTLLAFGAVFVLPALVYGQRGRTGTDAGQSKPIITSARHDTSRPLRDIAPLRPGKARKYENPMNFAKKAPATDQPDGALQSLIGPSVPVTAGHNFEGIGNGMPGFSVTVAPPDTTGDVGGPTSNPQSPSGQYVQWVNLSFAIFDKATGARIYGPAAG